MALVGRGDVDLALREVFVVVGHDVHPPLFFLIEWLMVRVHSSELAIRLPSLLASLGTLFVVQRLGTRHLDPLTGWFSAWILCLSPYTVAYAANARSGPLTALVGALVLSASLDVVTGRGPRRRALIVLGVAATLGFYVHYSVAMAVAAAGLGLLLVVLTSPRADGASARWGLVALGLAAAAFLPWVLGPMTGQSLEPKVPGRHFEVLRYLWWPVGPDFRARGATILVILAVWGVYRLLRTPGLRALSLGWVIGALLVPYLGSDRPGALGKFYLYAPLQPLFGLAVGVALSNICSSISGWTRLGAGRVATGLSAVILVASIGPLWWVLSARSNLVSVARLTPGVYDTRLEGRTLAAIPVKHPVQIRPEGRAAQDWLHYVPMLIEGPPPPGVILPPAWRATDRDDRPLQRVKLGDPNKGCTFNEAFAARLVVLTPHDCTGVLFQLDEVGRHEGYGPFLLELGLRAEAAGEAREAEELARAARDHSRVSARPDTLLARVLIAQGRYLDAGMAARSGAEKAARFRHREDWRALLELDVAAAEGLEDKAALDEAVGRLQCLDRLQFGPWEGWCAGGLWGLI